VAWNRTWAGLHLTASPVALSGDYTRYKDNGDRQPCNRMNTTFGSISSGHILNGWGAITFGTPMTKKQQLGKTPTK